MWLSALLVFVVLLLSAYLRLRHAGLGGGAHSPGMGHPPLTALTLIHRMAATLFALLVLAIAAFAVKQGPRGPLGLVLPSALLALTAFLSALGLITPAPLVPAVTVGNVLGGMTMLAMLGWLGLRLGSNGNHDPVSTRRLRPWARVALVLLLLQIALGAWVSGNYAGLSCPTLIGCEGREPGVSDYVRGLDPGRRLERATDGRVAVDASAPAVHLSHRFGAGGVLALLAFLALQARAAGGRLRTAGHALLALLALNLGLGLGAVAWGLPLWLVTAHNAGAALLLLAVVHLTHLLTPRTPT